METYLPYYHKKPNTFLRHEERPFDDGYGSTGIETLAIYKDKNGVVKEETAQVRFDRGQV